MSWSHLIEENRDLKTENAELRKLVGELSASLENCRDFARHKLLDYELKEVEELLARATELLKPTPAEKEDSHA